MDSMQRLSVVRRAGFWLGPLVGLALGWQGSWWGLADEGVVTWGLMGWMAVWWLSEAVPLAVTSFLPLVVLPAGGAATMSEASAPFASSIIFLFAGGFVLALAIQQVGLDRRIAVAVISRAGGTPDRLVAAFMIVAAALSAFISNTATTAMMLPLALSVIAAVDDRPDWSDSERGAFARSLLLGVAFAATIGGVATIIGSPPNALAAEYMREELGLDVSFAGWMMLAVPLTVVLLPAAWFLLTRILHPCPQVDVRSSAGGIRLGEGGPQAWKAPQRRVAAVFLVTAIAWLARPFVQQYVPWLGLLGDSGIAVAAAMACFILPAGRGLGPILDITAIRKLPWEILILFGGGLSLASGVKATGVAAALADSFASLPLMPAVVVVAIVAGGILLLTELTSNTATAATFIPILAAAAAVLGVMPSDLVLTAAAAASCAFMLPVATPPNAIVFSAGRLTIPDMAASGIWLNIASLLVITALSRTLWPYLLG